MNTELERIQKYMDGQLLAPAPRGLCHRIAEAIEGRDSAINELAEENSTLRGQVDDLKTAGRQARDDATAALDLVSRIRMALNDNGKRMQDELLIYCRELATLPARVTEMQAGYEESVDRRIALEARVAELEATARQREDLVQDNRERIQGLKTRETELEAAIIWALGAGEDFPLRGEGQGAYWWREELQKRAGLKWDGGKFISK